MPQQIPGYLWDTVRGHLGYSYTSGRPVTDVVGVRVWPTVLLLVPATILSVGLGILLGIRGGWRRGSRADITATGVSMTFYSIPEGWLAMMLLILFGSILKIFPLGGYASPTPLSGPTHVADVLSHLFLPVLTITIAYMGEYMLIMRSSLVDVKNEDYVQTARAKGLNDATVRRTTRAPQRAPSNRHPRLPELRLHLRRCRDHRGDLRLAGTGAAHLPGDRSRRTTP